MSEQGWQDFLAAEGVEDWVVLHGGATAVFRVQSLSEAGAPGQRDPPRNRLVTQRSRLPRRNRENLDNGSGD